MTTTNDMEFEFKCLQCGTVYRSELAHVGKHIHCTCGSLVKVVPPLESLIEPTVEQSKSASTKTSTGKKVPWFAVAGVVIAIAVVVFAARFTVERGRSDQSGQSAQAGNRVVVGEQPAKATTDEATDVRPISYHTLPTGTHLEEDIGTKWSRQAHRWKRHRRRRCCQAVQFRRPARPLILRTGPQHWTCRSDPRRLVPTGVYDRVGLHRIGRFVPLAS